jgi:hypothetical protein
MRKLIISLTTAAATAGRWPSPPIPVAPPHTSRPARPQATSGGSVIQAAAPAMASPPETLPDPRDCRSRCRRRGGQDAAPGAASASPIWRYPLGAAVSGANPTRDSPRPSTADSRPSAPTTAAAAPGPGRPEPASGPGQRLPGALRAAAPPRSTDTTGPAQRESASPIPSPPDQDQDKAIAANPALTQQATGRDDPVTGLLTRGPQRRPAGPRRADRPVRPRWPGPSAAGTGCRPPTPNTPPRPPGTSPQTTWAAHLGSPARPGRAARLAGHHHPPRMRPPPAPARPPCPGSRAGPRGRTAPAPAGGVQAPAPAASSCPPCSPPIPRRHVTGMAAVNANVISALPCTPDRPRPAAVAPPAPSAHAEFPDLRPQAAIVIDSHHRTERRISRAQW